MRHLGGVENWRERLTLERRTGREHHLQRLGIDQLAAGAPIPEEVGGVARLARRTASPAGRLRQDSEVRVVDVRTVGEALRHSGRPQDVVRGLELSVCPGMEGERTHRRPRIGGPGGRDVAGAAGDSPGRGELLVPEQRLAQQGLLGSKRVSRRHRRRLQRSRRRRRGGRRRTLRGNRNGGRREKQEKQRKECLGGRFSAEQARQPQVHSTSSPGARRRPVNENWHRRHLLVSTREVAISCGVFFAKPDSLRWPPPPDASPSFHRPSSRRWPAAPGLRQFALASPGGSRR